MGGGKGGYEYEREDYDAAGVYGSGSGGGFSGWGERDECGAGDRGERPDQSGTDRVRGAGALITRNVGTEEE